MLAQVVASRRFILSRGSDRVIMFGKNENYTNDTGFINSAKRFNRALNSDRLFLTQLCISKKLFDIPDHAF